MERCVRQPDDLNGQMQSSDEDEDDGDEDDGDDDDDVTFVSQLFFATHFDYHLHCHIIL